MFFLDMVNGYNSSYLGGKDMYDCGVRWIMIETKPGKKGS
jgi:hypothetical protein